MVYYFIHHPRILATAANSPPSRVDPAAPAAARPHPERTKPMTISAYAIRYASATTTRAGTFLRYDIYGEPDGELACDFYYWVLKTPEGPVLVDSGFTHDVASRRNQKISISIQDGLASLGLVPDDIGTVILSHLHYDHIGNLEHFTRARIIVQRSEFEFWNGPMANRAQFAQLREEAYLQHILKANAEDRLVLVDGDADVQPGIRVIHLGGHTPGTQAVAAETVNGPLVLASDAVHFHDELDKDLPFNVCSNLPAMYESFDKLRDLARSGALIIPGHDARVATDYSSQAIGSGAGRLIDLQVPLAR